MALRRVVVIIAALSLAVVLGACSGSKKPGRTVTKYVNAPTPSASAPSRSVSTSPVAPKPPASLTKLPGTCNNKLSLDRVAPAIGETLGGLTAFVIGTADPSIHRVSYINCRYGLASSTSTPAVEIQVSLYGTAAQATARIAPTVTDYKNNGATAQKTNANGIPATILTGGTGADYSSTTLVLAFGQRTVAVSVSNAVATDKQAHDLTTLAALAVKQTQ